MISFNAAAFSVRHFPAMGRFNAKCSNRQVSLSAARFGMEEKRQYQFLAVLWSAVFLVWGLVGYVLSNRPIPELKGEPPQSLKPPSYMATDTTYVIPLIVLPKSKSAIREVDEGNFTNEVLRSDKPVVVAFGLPEAQSFRDISPVLEKLARQYKGQVKFVKANPKNNPLLENNYQVQNGSDIRIFVRKNKGDVFTAPTRKGYVGFKSESAFVSWLQDKLLSTASVPKGDIPLVTWP
jgi:thioredoxin 1